MTKLLCRDSSQPKGLSIAYFTYSYKGIFLVDMDVDKIEIFTLRGCVTEKHKKNIQKTSRDREFLGDPWGDFAKIFRVGRGHSYLQKPLNIFLGGPI